MLIFVYEFVTGGGTFCDDSFGPPSGSLLAQGAAMAAALVEDLAAIDEVEVIAMRACRIKAQRLAYRNERVVSGSDQESQFFHELAAAADFTILIAPESNGHLLDRCKRVEQCGGRLLSPGCPVVSLASDKYETNRTLNECGVQVPGSVVRSRDSDLPSGWKPPFVKKPRWGAGSEDVRRIHKIQLLANDSPAFVIEQFAAGQPASVSAMCGPQQCVILPPCSQLIATDGRFGYRGGRYPLNHELARRAKHLAKAAVDALPTTTGYIGIDLVMGEATDGSSDVVIEVNPRLTTSYVALRTACASNLASAMVDVALGKPVELSFYDRPLEFTFDGKINRGQLVPH